MLDTYYEAIKNRADIVEVISHFEQLKSKGTNYVCKCFFHNEKTASFTISRAKGRYHCFGCGVGGDVIKFIQEHKKLSYRDAMNWLGDFYNLQNSDGIQNKFKDSLQDIAITHKPASLFIPKDIFYKSLTDYKNNNFVKFLHTLFEPFVVNMLIDKYYIGTSKYFSGGSVFWQIDRDENIRYGKIMEYNPQNGKRIKDPYDKIMSVNSAIINKLRRENTPLPDWVIKYDAQSPKPQVLFGLHLIQEDLHKPIAIVESEKTAIIASVFIPSFIWMATGTKGIMKYNDKGKLNSIPETLKEKFKPLTGRKILLVPDLGAIEDWQYLASELSNAMKISVSGLIQSLAKNYSLPDKSDLCDYMTSGAARNKIIQEFIDEIILRNPQTESEHCEIWLEFSERGLRRIDQQKAYKDLITRHDYEIVSN